MTRSLTTVDDYRALLDRVFDEQVAAWTAEAERTEKWGDAAQPDVAKLVALAFSLGRLGSAGIGVGVSLHDSAIALLRRFGRSDHLRSICEQAVRGEAVLCIAASEESGGSDLQIVETEIRSARGGFEVRGVKKFVSLSPIADYIMVVARSVDQDPTSRHGNVVVIAVPTSQVEVQPPYRKVGAGPTGHRGRPHRHLGAGRGPGRPGRHRAGRNLVGPRARAALHRRPGGRGLPADHRNHSGAHDETSAVRPDAVPASSAAPADGRPAGPR
jgi:alkylation response protein AidB-like acyl-CoA dehydrogenase